jgi:subtilisin-like proprotein convertase family protein
MLPPPRLRPYGYWLIVLFCILVGTPATTTAQTPTNPDKDAATDSPTDAQPPAPIPPRPANSQTFSNLIPVAIPDNGYIGTLDGNDGFGTDAGMACSTVNTTGLVPASSTVYNTSINVTINHTWVGDLTLKLRSPGGQILTLLNRAGSTAPDDGTDSPVGDSSNWNGGITFGDGAGPEAETMGVGLADTQTICTNNGVCAHDPSPDTALTSVAAFANFRSTAASGVWTLCAGDSVELDNGTLNHWQLTLNTADVYVNATAGSIPDDGYIGGLGGAGQLCRAITVASPASASVLGSYIDATLTHTWVGDLTMKLRSPNATILTVLNRPGSTAPDDGTGAVGNNANWNGLITFGDGFGPEAELMGNTLTTNQVICTANGVCAHDPSPDTATQPPSAFSAFNGGVATGSWNLCVGDSALGDVGNLNQWRLYLQRSAISLAITLESISATATEEGVRVAWETASEVDNLGFHLYRTTDPAFVGERLTSELILSTSPGSGQGAFYEWTDTTAEAGVAYYYTLEDVDVNGVGTAHPPVPLTPDSPTAVTLDSMTSQAGFPMEWVSLVGLGFVFLGFVWRRTAVDS